MVSTSFNTSRWNKKTSSLKFYQRKQSFVIPINYTRTRGDEGDDPRLLGALLPPQREAVRGLDGLAVRGLEGLGDGICFSRASAALPCVSISSTSPCRPRPSSPSRLSSPPSPPRELLSAIPASLGGGRAVAPPPSPLLPPPPPPPFPLPLPPPPDADAADAAGAAPEFVKAPALVAACVGGIAACTASAVEITGRMRRAAVTARAVAAALGVRCGPDLAAFAGLVAGLACCLGVAGVELDAPLGGDTGR
jgi:hypothetical protein